MKFDRCLRHSLRVSSICLMLVCAVVTLPGYGKSASRTHRKKPDVVWLSGGELSYLRFTARKRDGTLTPDGDFQLQIKEPGAKPNNGGVAWQWPTTDHANFLLFGTKNAKSTWTLSVKGNPIARGSFQTDCNSFAAWKTENLNPEWEVSDPHISFTTGGLMDKYQVLPSYTIMHEVVDPSGRTFKCLETCKRGAPAGVSKGWFPDDFLPAQTVKTGTYRWRILLDGKLMGTGAAKCTALSPTSDGALIDMKVVDMPTGP